MWLFPRNNAIKSVVPIPGASEPVLQISTSRNRRARIGTYPSSTFLSFFFPTLTLTLGSGGVSQSCLSTASKVLRSGRGSGFRSLLFCLTRSFRRPAMP